VIRSFWHEPNSRNVQYHLAKDEPPEMSPQCFIIGYPIGHSRSPLIHHYWLEQHGLAGAYGKRDVSPDDLAGYVEDIRKGHIAGGNVTIPLKELVFPLVDILTPAAQAIGAVNTLYRDHGKVIGDNTDALGLMAHLDVTCPDWQATTKSILILGAGGAARAALFGLLARKVPQISISNRDPVRAAGLAKHFGAKLGMVPWENRHAAVADADLIINTTALGMAGKPSLELDLSAMRPGTIVYDIVYVPLETPLLADARARGGRSVDGLGMLLHQAVPGFQQWFGVKPVVTPQLRAHIVADLVA
jgi:shikimate dehydrogenase